MIREHLIKAHPERDGAFRWRGDGVSRIEGLSDAVFGARVNENLIYESVRHYLAGQRSGSAKTKVRREVSGSSSSAGVSDAKLAPAFTPTC